MTSWVDDGKISRINGLIDEYEKNEDKYRINQESSLPLAERIFKDEKSLKLLSNEKFNLLQNIFYVKELGEVMIRRNEYEKAIKYFFDLFDDDFLYFKYHAYKTLKRIFDKMDNLDNLKRFMKVMLDNKLLFSK